MVLSRPLWRKCKNILFVSAAFLFWLCSDAVAEKLIQFDIPKQSADTALQLFGQQSKRTIIYSHALAKGKQTNSLQGYYSDEQALHILLRNTGLVAATQVNGAIVVALTSSDALPLKHDPNSEKELISDTLEATSMSMEKISVFGQPYRTRSAVDFSVPIDIITSEQLQATGQKDLGRMLQMLAPSFNYPSSAISDGTDVLKPATLRGLGPDQILVLINGKRRHQASLVHINTSVGRGTAGVDFNAISINAIDKIEILRDGAAARFGSDAIAGVINIVLKAGVTPNKLAIDYGEFSQSDGEKRGVHGELSFPLFNGGFFNLALSYQTQEKTNRAGLQASCQFENCKKLKNGHWLSTTTKEHLAQRDVFQIGNPEFNQFISSYNAAIPMGKNKLYSFAMYSNRKNESAAFFRHYNNEESNPMLSDGQRLSLTGYLPLIQSDISDVSYTLGLKKHLATNTNIDLSYSFGKNTIDYHAKNSFNPSYAVYQDKILAKTPESIRLNTPASVKAYDLSLSLQTINLDLMHYANWAHISAGVELRQDTYQISPGERYSYYDFKTNIGDLSGNTIGGIQGFPGISPNQQVNQRRDVLSVYADLNTDVTQQLHFSSAIRFDSYSDFGNTSNLKLAALWQATDKINIRSSVSTGFRAPAMPQLYFNNISSQFIVNNDNELIAEHVGTFRNDSQLAKNIGINPLTEEKSLNFSLGASLSLAENLSLTIDLYRIEIDDRIVISNKLCADDSVQLSLALAQENIEKAQFFLNGADTITQGIDLISQWQHPLRGGQLSVTFAANYTDTEVKRLIAPQSEALSPLTVEQIFAKQDISIIEEWQPESRISVTSQYDIGPWSFNFALNHFGQYTITDGQQQTFSPEILTDLRLNYTFNKQLTAYIGSNNVFNVNPDRNQVGNSHGGTIVDQDGDVIVSSPGVFKYSRRSAPFGFNGRYAYMGMSYTF